MRKIIVAGVLLLLLLIGLFLMQSKKAETKASELVFYGRVFLGPNSTNSDLILHFIVQGERIFLDRNKDDLAQPEERLLSNELEPITDSATGLTYHVKQLRLTKTLAIVTEELPQNLALTAVVSGDFSFEQLGRLVLSLDPQQPGCTPINGNNHLMCGDSELDLIAGNLLQLRFYFGTNVSDCKAAPSSSTPQVGTTPDGIQLVDIEEFSPIVPHEDGPHPELIVEIPTAGEPFIDRGPLNEFCCGMTFARTIRIPSDAVPGKAKVKVTFDKWTIAPIQPLEFEMNVVGRDQ